jgi:hypothetical protein
LATNCGNATLISYDAVKEIPQRIRKSTTTTVGMNSALNRQWFSQPFHQFAQRIDRLEEEFRSYGATTPSGAKRRHSPSEEIDPADPVGNWTKRGGV